jgi:serine/threonine protein kinase
MDNKTLDTNDLEDLVNLAIYDYHAAVERGESPNPEAWAARNPEIANELAAYFEDLKALDLLRPSPSDAPEVNWTLVGGFDLKPGDTLGDYVLAEKLGEGGQGVVWKASPKKQRNIVVALKTLSGLASDDPVSNYRLREDVRAIAMMKHPNIIRTFYFGEDRGRWFFVMELMEGGTVADRLGSYGSDPRSAAVLIEKVARAIHHAHTRNPGVSHLDLKPGNILLTEDGEPKVTDFGVSARFKTLASSGVSQLDLKPGSILLTEDGELRLTDVSLPLRFETLISSEVETGSSNPGDEEVAATIARIGMVGTIPYMSPEMAAGRWSSDVSTASDIYGLGAILYAMLTGHEPFRGETREETLALVIHGELKSPGELNPKVDRELNAVCLKCLDRDPKKRCGSADALANDLRRWLEGRPTLAGGKPSAARELRFWVRRHPRGVALAAVGAVSLWLAILVGSEADLRVENAREAGRLASQVDRELRLIRRATQVLANDPRLRSAFSSSAADQSGQRRGTIELFLKTAVESENVLGNPFVNVFVLGPDGVLLADTLQESPAIGMSFSVRDYYRAFLEKDRPRDYVYVARSFKSVKDDRYKIAVSTRVWDDRRNLLGHLVANFTIGPRLIDVDLRHERNDAVVLCPMDRSDPRIPRDDPVKPWQYISVLDRRYTVDWKDAPIKVDLARLRDFQIDTDLIHSAEGRVGGKLVNYHRVGESHMVVVTRRTSPWPLSWLPDFR